MVMENLARKSEKDFSWAEIAGQLMTDVQTLIRQESALLRADISNELNEKRIRFQKVAFGVFSGLLGQIGLAIALVFFLNEVAGLPLWASFGLVGGGLATAGYFLAMAPKKEEEKKDYDNAKYGITRTASGTN